MLKSYNTILKHLLASWLAVSLLHSLTIRLRQFDQLSGGERWLLIESAVLMPLVALWLKLFGFKRVQSLLTRWFAGPARSEVSITQVQRIADIVSVVPRRIYKPSLCLDRSMTLWALLRQRGIETQLCIGASKSGGSFAAHAWVEYNGTVLNDSRSIRERYVVLTEVNIPIQQFTD
jgi:hypothetical protein